MHEWSLAERVRCIVLEEASGNALSSIRKVTLEVGALSCVEPGVLQFAIEKNLEDSIAADADIRIRTRMGKLKCYHCGKVFEAEDMYQACAYCNQYGFTIIDGKDMLVTGIEGV
ncbi:MAG: hydrogenase maturation nickel metallochaperone HypA [Gammaproteobacteria bacterium]|nr:hydrogenase maturation nickel metallochaperone HypA [Gammaproteobacteria bacterium]NNM10297.1 hydrogenase maturation nickel metallochaperone HypA [Pseudomonadales bacterium]